MVNLLHFLFHVPRSAKRLKGAVRDKLGGDSAAQQPQLSVSIERVNAAAEPDGSHPETRIRITWKMKLVLQNDSEAAAAELKLIWPEDKPRFHVLLPYYLGGFEDKAALFKVEETLPREGVPPAASPDRLWELLPRELQQMTLVLSYRNSKGKTFYTKCGSKDGEPSCEFSSNLPSLDPPGGGAAPGPPGRLGR